MTRMAVIKAKYDACELSYETALARLEALGMWASQADDYLSQPTLAVTSHQQNIEAT